MRDTTEDHAAILHDYIRNNPDGETDAIALASVDALAAERDALRKAVTLALFYLGGEEADEVRAALGKYDPT